MTNTSKWIATEDKMPPIWETVFLCKTGDNINGIFYGYLNNEGWFSCYGLHRFDATHWQPVTVPTHIDLEQTESEK